MPDAPSLSTSLTPQEVALLEQALPRLADWSEKILVPFSVRQLRHCEVVWINERWFLQRGLDVTEESTRHRLSNWLCEEFGYAAPRQEDSFEAYTEQSKTFHADRYGSLNAREVHGGSGRAAIVGCFQAKGIGVTPLAGAGADWIHSHGCASLEEAIREAIYAEVLAAEFPYSAIPIIAILDTGLTFSRPSSEHPEEALMRRAIILRPSVVRHAHAQRAPAFRKSLVGYSNSQLDDVQRCRDMVRQWLERTSRPYSSTPNYPQSIARVVEQMAFSQVHRLSFCRRSLSASLTIEGALLEVGRSFALGNWNCVESWPNAEDSGNDQTQIEKLTRSLFFHFKKYRFAEFPPLPPIETLVDDARDIYEKTFCRECLRLWGLQDCNVPSLVDRLSRPMRQYFALQRRTRNDRRLSSHAGRLYDAMLGGAAKEDGPEFVTLCAISAALRSHFTEEASGRRMLRYAWMTAVRLLQPRTDIVGQNLPPILRLVSREMTQSMAHARTIRDTIAITVGESRRHWPNLPDDLVVMGHTSIDGSSMLLCRQMQNDEIVLWLEGIKCGERLRLFGFWTSFADIPSDDCKHHGDSWSARVLPTQYEARPEGYMVKALSQVILLPPLRRVYPNIDARWQ